jgi:hypothetical protein
MRHQKIARKKLFRKLFDQSASAILQTRQRVFEVWKQALLELWFRQTTWAICPGVLSSSILDCQSDSHRNETHRTPAFFSICLEYFSKALRLNDPGQTEISVCSEFLSALDLRVYNPYRRLTPVCN